MSALLNADQAGEIERLALTRSLLQTQLAALKDARADLNTVLAVDPSARTGRNFALRDNLDARIERARAKLCGEILEGAVAAAPLGVES